MRLVITYVLSRAVYQITRSVDQFIAFDRGDAFLRADVLLRPNFVVVRLGNPLWKTQI